MSRVTIDFGIDLGTTNSEICVLKGMIQEPIKNNLNAEVTPSAVYINKRGDVVVGTKAKERIEGKGAVGDGHIEFKRRMGTDHSYKFLSAGRAMSPVELSAEVLKSLRGDVQQQLGEIINAAVITVPAAFEQRQCAATREAAALAGFVQSPLLQEPVAAALAYGFQADVQKEYWLVFDFGGGTFDAAVIKAEDGTISVVNHGGDNFLGGADIDWAIFNQIVLPQIKDSFNLKGFARGADGWSAQQAEIKREIERTKISLSRKDKEVLEACILDADGNECAISLDITRNQVIDVAEPVILRAVSICQKVLEEKNLPHQGVAKMILVGGPTLAPYFREILADKLPIPIDHSVDPMTVVARGAAVFAGAQRLEGDAAPKARVGQFNIKLVYNPIGADEDPKIKGKVESPSDVSTDGYTVELIQTKTKWSSGKIPLRQGGVFSAILLAERGYQNEFTLELRDAMGVLLETVPNRLTYTMGAAPTEQVLPVTVGVGLADNGVDPIFKKNDPLPNKASRKYISTAMVKAGDKESKLYIPVIEGENVRADRNRCLGGLVVNGEKVSRDIPAGQDVELTVSIDASRIIRLKAYIPILDEEYDAKIDYNTHTPDVSYLKKALKEDNRRLQVLLEKEDGGCETGQSGHLQQLQERSEAAAVLLGNANDPDAAQQAEKRMLEIRVELDAIEDSFKFPSMLKEVEESLEKLKEAVEENGTPSQKSQVAKWRQELGSIAEKQASDKLRRLQDKIVEMHHGFMHNDPEFWKAFLAFLYQNREKMTDQASANRLFNLAAQHMDSNNISAMANIARQLYQLLPPEVAAAAPGGLGSTVAAQ